MWRNASGLALAIPLEKSIPDFRARQSTGSCGRRDGLYGYALSIIWLALSLAFLLTPGVARAQQYAFQNIAFPNDTFTQLLGINDADVIAGYHGIDINQGFTLNLPNSFTLENFPTGVLGTQVTGINDLGNTSGFGLSIPLGAANVRKSERSCFTVTFTLATSCS